MKNLVFISLLSVSLAMSACGQKVSVPDVVSRAFTSKFPGATDIKWDKENAKEYEAEFKLNNADVSANFGTDGSWKETETTINSGELPAGITQALNSKYPGAVMGVCERIEKPGNKLLYEVNIKFKGKKKELEMTPEGTVVE